MYGSVIHACMSFLRTGFHWWRLLLPGCFCTKLCVNVLLEEDKHLAFAIELYYSATSCVYTQIFVFI